MTAVPALALLLLAPPDRWTAERHLMVEEQIAGRGVADANVLEAMRKVPRHLFVPEGRRDQAYDDRPLPIGSGQTISQPYIVGLMTDLLDVDRSHKVLEIGTGSGYQAAILGEIAGQVYTIEVVPELARTAREALKSYKNVMVRLGDGYKGWPDQAPFDRIILTAAPPEIPQPLIDQLKPGGKLVAPVGRSPFAQNLVVLTKDQKGRIERRTVIPVMFVPMVPAK